MNITSKNGCLMITLFSLILGLLFGSVNSYATPGLDSNPSRGPGGRLANPDNKHNLSNNSINAVKAADPTAGGTTQICIFCHTPHAAEPDTPLWNRPDPDASTFLLYGQNLAIAGTLPGAEDPTAPDRTGYTTAVEYPNGSSRLCMSCHDGITAIGSLNDNTTIAMLGSETMPATSVVDLTASHPISFIYTEAIKDEINLAYGGSSVFQFPDPNDNVDTPLDGLSRMQCTTCHDPHYDAQMEDATLPPFWRQKRVSKTALEDPYDDVCNACHIGDYTASPAFPGHTNP